MFILRLIFISVIPAWLCKKETIWPGKDLLATRTAPWEDIRRARRLTGTDSL